MIHYSFMIIPDLSTIGNDDTIRRTLDLIKSCGYAGVELNMTGGLTRYLDKVASWIEERELTIPSFLTGEAYNEGLCLSSPKESVRKKTVARLIDYLDTARRFNAILVVGLLQGLLSDEPDRNTANKRIVECLKQVGEAAVLRGVELVIEPVNHLQVGFYNSVAEVANLVADIDSPSWKLMVDTIHMNIEESSLTKPIYEFKSNIRHVHLCESNGGVFGSGNVDFAAVLRALDDIGYDHFASIKVYRKSTLNDAISHSIAHLSGLR